MVIVASGMKTQIGRCSIVLKGRPRRRAAAPYSLFQVGAGEYRALGERVRPMPATALGMQGWLDAGPKARRHNSSVGLGKESNLILFEEARVLGAVRLAVRDGISMVRRVEEA